MPKEEITLQNFSGGEQSPKMYNRWDLPITRNGCRRVKNFQVETQGGASFRTGFCHVHHTRLNEDANLIRFEFNDEQAYQLQFTNRKLRFYRNEAIVLEDTQQTITGLTQTDPGVVTAVAHGYEDGDEVFINDVQGMTEINSKSYIVANKTTNTFELTDVFGNNVDTSSFTAYSSGGICERIYEIHAPYEEGSDIFKLKVTQNADTMYIAHGKHSPRKLTRTDHDSWTLVRYTRTNDPFLGTEVAITGITQADPGVVTATSHGFADGDIVEIYDVTGMTEVNERSYIVANKAANTFELTDLQGNNVDTTNFTAYSSGGKVTKMESMPAAVSFYESRLWFGGTILAPDKFFGSRAPEGPLDANPGDPRYDDFTTGTDDDHALEFSIADAEVNKILWLTGTDRLLLSGSFGSETKIQGETTEKAITPTSVSARAINRLGVADIAPINKVNIILYVQRGSLTVKSFEFDALGDAFVSTDQNLVSEHITKSGLKQIAWQTGRPDVLWGIRNDGVLTGMTFKEREGISSWYRYLTGATGEDKFTSVSTMPRPSSFDQLWVVTEREINGNTTRNVEYQADVAEIPDRIDFFTRVNNKTTDDATYLRAVLEAQKFYKHVDAALIYDGSSVGSIAGSAVTPGAVTGDSVTFTADVAVFLSSDEGRQIWKKAINGIGEGRAEITTFNSSTSVTCKILQDFDNTDEMAAGNWYLTAGSLSNLDHLEGRTIKVITDGGVHPDEVVSSGAITLDYQSSYVVVGLGYEGLLMPMSLEFGGGTGPGQTKLKHIHEVGIVFRETLGAEFGTDLYRPQNVPFTKMPLQVGTPQPIFSGVKRVPYGDSWDSEKIIYIRQNNPLPCNVQLLAIYGEARDD